MLTYKVGHSAGNKLASLIPHFSMPIDDHKSISNLLFCQIILPMKASISDSKSYISEQDLLRVTRSTRALFAAILTRALKDIFKPTYDDYDLYKKQALHWIEANDLESFTSFLNICDYLDIDVERIRRSVYNEMGKIELRTKS